MGVWRNLRPGVCLLRQHPVQPLRPRRYDGAHPKRICEKRRQHHPQDSKVRHVRRTLRRSGNQPSRRTLPPPVGDYAGAGIRAVHRRGNQTDYPGQARPGQERRRCRPAGGNAAALRQSLYEYSAVCRYGGGAAAHHAAAVPARIGHRLAGAVQHPGAYGDFLRGTPYTARWWQTSRGATKL